MDDSSELGDKLFEGSAEAIVLLHDGGRIVRQNRAAAALLGYAVGDVTALAKTPPSGAFVPRADGRRLLLRADETPLSGGHTLLVLSSPRERFGDGSARMSESLLTGTDASCILEALAEITGRTLALDRSLIYEIRLDTNEAAALCEWLNPDIEVAATKATYPLEVFAGGDGFMRATKGWLESHADAPHPALVEDGSASVLHGPMAVKSLLWFPFGFRETRYYALVFNQVTERRTWLEAERELVRIATWQVTLALRQIALMGERAKAERAMLEAQKLEVIRLLAAGVAHDLGSHLGIVLGSLDRARRVLAPDGAEPKPAALAALRDAEGAALEASGLAKHLVAYSGRGQFVVEPVDLSVLTDDMQDLLHAVARPVPVAFERATDPSWISADATQIRQVLMNLVLNAVQAIASSSGHGSITVAAHHEGDRVALTVRDTGPGMSEEVQRRIFEPFFSTKGGGRGLGLAAALGIVRAHGGELRVESEPGAGATFTALFPAVAPPSARAREVRVPDGPRVALRGHLLLADDTENFRATTEKLLTGMGFDVTSVPDGEAAVGVLEQRDDIDVLVMDWMMSPGGAETLERARDAASDLPVVVMSGYTEEALSFDRDGRTTFLEKPFRLEQLEAALRSVLASRAEGPRAGAP